MRFTTADKRSSADPGQLVDEQLKQSLPPLVVPAVSTPGANSRNRLFEWCMAAAMTGMALVMAYDPAALSGSRFWIISTGIGYALLFSLCSVFGALRLLALYYNGTWHASYKLRAAGALAGAAVWMNMAIALMLSGGPISISIPVYLALSAGELRSCWRAAVDERVC